MTDTTPVERAAADLHSAAALADHRANGNPFDPWTAMAGTIRLVAAGLHPAAEPPTDRAGDGEPDLHTYLEQALAALDGMPAAAAPTDLAFWRAHVFDLAANARTLEAPPLDTTSRR